MVHHLMVYNGAYIILREFFRRCRFQKKNYHILKEYKRIHIESCSVLIQERPPLFTLSSQPRVIMNGKQIKYEAYVGNRYQARVVRHLY